MIGSKNQTVWLAKLDNQKNLSTPLQSLLIANAVLVAGMVVAILVIVKKKRNLPQNQVIQGNR